MKRVRRVRVEEGPRRIRTEEGLGVSEARYRLHYNRTPMALHSTKAEALLIDVKDTWLAMFGYHGKTSLAVHRRARESARVRLAMGRVAAALG
jgi:hypothetical protein